MFIYIHNVECHNADVVFTVSQSTKINLHFICSALQKISSAVSGWLVTRCIKSPLKYRCDSRSKFMSWLKQSGHLGGGAGQQHCHCALSPGQYLHHNTLHCSPAREMLSNYNRLFIYFTKTDQSNSAFSSCLNIQIKLSQ